MKWLRHAVDSPPKIVVPPDCPLRHIWSPQDNPWRLTLLTIYIRNPAPDPSCKWWGDHAQLPWTVWGDHVWYESSPLVLVVRILTTIGGRANWQVLTNSPNHQIKNLAKVSRYTVGRLWITYNYTCAGALTFKSARNYYSVVY